MTGVTAAETYPITRAISFSTNSRPPPVFQSRPHMCTKGQYARIQLLDILLASGNQILRKSATYSCPGTNTSRGVFLCVI
jgi:hypothetical protein